jgi:large subunit ribosomal protein L20
MSRVKRGVIAKKRRKKVLALAAGYRGRNNNCYSVAIEKVEKAMQYNYRDRKNRKRTFRSLWIVRINAALRQMGLKYSTFMHKLADHDCDVNRKMLADLAMNNEHAFVNFVKTIAEAKQ